MKKLSFLSLIHHPSMAALFLFLGFSLLSLSHAQLRTGFYSSSCPNAENIVSEVVKNAFGVDATVAPALLRLHFHDCFVQGCDGSILIDGTNAERKANGHQGLRGFEVIAQAKSQLEAACPGTVSCADIVALSARDSIVLTKGPDYEVETGRKDGRRSSVDDASDLPDIADSVEVLKSKFQQKGLSDQDLVILSAAHTIGTTACFFMESRLYNYASNGGSDPSITPEFLPELQSKCPQNGDVNVRLDIDRGSGGKFDDSILNNIRNGMAVLQSDAVLYEDDSTRSIVDSYMDTIAPEFFGSSFESDFTDSMIKLGRTEVKTDSEGEIRRVCSAFN